MDSTGSSELVERKKTVQEYYRKRAMDYDQQKSRTWQSERGFGAEIIDEVINALSALKGKEVLEVGVGSGRIAQPLISEVEPYFVGLDLSREMLKSAKTKLSPHRRSVNLVLGDAEHLPFTENAFDAIICMSTMHYFADQRAIVADFRDRLKRPGVFVYGDLTLHELDNRGFLDRMERLLSKPHAKYYKPDEMKKLLEKQGFQVPKTRTVPYRKSYEALIEDKGRYFGVKREALQEFVSKATPEEQELYGLGKNEMTLFYTLITALKDGRAV